MAAAQEEGAKEEKALFERGESLLRQGDYMAAEQIFAELEARFENSKNLPVYIFSHAKASYYLRDYRAAIVQFDAFVSRFPDSKFLAEVNFFRGNAHYLNNDVTRAVEAYIKAYSLSQSGQLDELLLGSLGGVFQNAASVNLDADDFAEVPDARKCGLIEPLADILNERRQFNQATALLAICTQVGGEQNAKSGDNKKVLQIAVMVPLSGELQSYGNEIYNGAATAAELYRKETGSAIRLIPYDTKGDPIETGRLVKILTDDKNIDVILGPLTSDETSVASAMQACGDLPLVAPAATQAGLTQLSSNTFQLSPNVELEGIAMADFAVNTLRADTAVILSSTDMAHLRATEAFSARFKKLGGTILATQYYRTRDKDFGSYIKDIKRLIIGAERDSIYYTNESGDTIDYSLLPARVDCIFLPGESRQLRLLLPQIHFYNLNGYYVGNDGWGDAEIYRLGDDVVKHAVFASPFLEGHSSEEYVKLATAYDMRYGERPQRLASLGYDAVKLIHQAVRGGSADRATILSNLGRMERYDGASGRVTFGPNRENMEMPLYRIDSGQALPLIEAAP